MPGRGRRGKGGRFFVMPKMVACVVLLAMNAKNGWLTLIAAAAMTSLVALASPTPAASGGLPDRVAVRDGSGASLELRLARMVMRGEFVSGFGWRRHPMGGGGAHHDGIDIKAPRGAPVRAAAAGIVVHIGWGRAFGRYVRVRHGDDLETLYAHLARVPKSLKAGHRVTPEDVIGFVGSTGRSTGPHLHFEVRRDGKPLDPLTGEPRRRPIKKKARVERS